MQTSGCAHVARGRGNVQTASISTCKAALGLGSFRTWVVPGIGLALGFFSIACAHMNGATPANHTCGSPFKAGTVLSLLPLNPSYAQGIFAYRSVEYRITIRNWEWEPKTYQGAGFVCGLGAPADIAGLYTVERGGAVLRNENGVQIDLQPPLPVQSNAPKLEIQLAGALLPRQP